MPLAMGSSVFSIAVMLVGVVAFAYIVGTIGAMEEETNQAALVFQSKMQYAAQSCAILRHSAPFCAIL